MAFCGRKIVNRGEKYDDSDCANKWKWDWISVVENVKHGDTDLVERLGTRFRKLVQAGMAVCVVCNVELSYASRGLATLKEHLHTKRHVARCISLEGNQRLPGTEPETLGYGMDPALKAVPVVSEEKSATLTSVKDRTSNLEALTLAFASEKGLSLSIFPDLIEYAKTVSHDKPALQELCMDRTTASYKLREGLGPYLRSTFLEELRTTPFSLNIDEATSKTNQRVLAVLVSHFSPSHNRVMVNHLDSVTLTTVTAKSLFEELEAVFVKYDLPWNNLVSVMMDSCAVMRGAKSGLEACLRKKVPTLLDIDVDTCHHSHIAARQFCQHFDGIVESFMCDVHTEFKWCTDLRDKLYDVCHLLGVSATAPERYVPHRWLSVLAVAVDTVRLFDCYSLIFYSYLLKEDQDLHKDVLDKLLDKLSDKGKISVQQIQNYVQQKMKSATKEGKDRKQRLADKCFNRRIQLLSTLHIYTSILPTLQKYVLFFQKKDTQMHQLHVQQHELFNEFCSFFLKPESLVDKMPHQVKVEDTNSHKQIFFPMKALELLSSREGLSHKKVFADKLKKAYIACALTLQKKMPVNNPVLKACAALDPTIRTNLTTQSYLSALAKLTVYVPPTAGKKKKGADNKTGGSQGGPVPDGVLVSAHDRDNYRKEVMAYTTSASITVDPEMPIDVFWATVDAERFPLLTGVAKKLLSAFHGPAVESSFSVMGDILHAGCSRMDIDTYSAIQTTRYFLTANKTSALQFFSKKDPVAQPVPSNLAKCMQNAWKKNKARQQNKQDAFADRKASLGAPAAKPASKTSAKRKIVEESTTTAEPSTSQPAPSTSQPAPSTSQPAPSTSQPPKVQKIISSFFKKVNK